MKYGIWAEGPALGPVRSFSAIMKIIRNIDGVSQLYKIQKTVNHTHLKVTGFQFVEFVVGEIEDFDTPFVPKCSCGYCFQLVVMKVYSTEST